MKNYILLTISCVCVLVMGACGSGSNKSNSNSSESKFKQNVDLNYQKACEELDFGKAHEILEKLRNEFVNEGLPKAQNCQVTSIKGYQAYVDADIYIFREEATYLMGLDDPAAEPRILKMIMETPLDGRKLDEGHCSFYDALEDNGDGNKVWLYSYCIKRNNQKCDIVMDLSILHNNKTLAKKVLSYYKDNMHIVDDRYWNFDDDVLRINVKGKTIIVDGDHGYIWYDSADKDAAQKKYNEAVKDGMFE